MKSVVVREVEQLLYRPNIPVRPQYVLLLRNNVVFERASRVNMQFHSHLEIKLLQIVSQNVTVYSYTCKAIFAHCLHGRN